MTETCNRQNDCWCISNPAGRPGVPRPRGGVEAMAVDVVSLARDDPEERRHHFLRLDEARGTPRAAHRAHLVRHTRCVGVYLKTAESGSKRAHVFCPECGTPIYAAAPEQNPSTYGLRVGGIDQRAQLAPPARQFWCRSALPWSTRAEFLDRVASGPSPTPPSTARLRRFRPFAGPPRGGVDSSGRTPEATYPAGPSTRSGSQPPSTPRHQALAAATASISISNSGATSALTMIVAEPGRASPKCFARAAPAAATSSGRTK
jgi:hypothetical protein